MSVLDTPELGRAVSHKGRELKSHPWAEHPWFCKAWHPQLLGERSGRRGAASKLNYFRCKKPFSLQRKAS